MLSTPLAVTRKVTGTASSTGAEFETADLFGLKLDPKMLQNVDDDEKGILLRNTLQGGIASELGFCLVERNGYPKSG